MLGGAWLPSAVVSPSPRRSCLPRPATLRFPALVALGALVAVVPVACGGGRPSRDAQVASIASAAGLPADVAAFFARAGRTDGAYQVTYVVTTADKKRQQITLTQHPPDRRIDIYSPDGTIDSTFRLHGTSYQCTRTADKWQCGRLRDQADHAGLLDDNAAANAVATFRKRAADFDFVIDGRTIAGAAATCLVTTRKSGHDDPTLGRSATLCLSAEGAQLLVEVPRGRLEATAYRTDLPAGSLDPPAPLDGEPVGASGASTASRSSS